METCKTCKFWDNKFEFNTALCIKLSGEHVESGVMAIRTNENDDEIFEEEIHTGCNFGCIHHESK